LRVLLDENLPRRLGPLLAGHDCRTVKQMGWSGVKNGHLLARAQAEFDVFLTMDQGIPFQQNVRNHGIAVFLLRARSNSLPSLQPMVPAILIALQQPQKSALTIIEL
jgi:hypothetical protein